MLIENKDTCSLNNFSKVKKLHKIISDVAYELFNTDTKISMIYWDHKDAKENYKILKDLLWLEKLKPNNFQILQMVDKQIDNNHIVKWFLLKVKWKNSTWFKNVTAVIERWKKNKKLLHVHISEPKKLDWTKVVELGKKYRQNHMWLENNETHSNWISNKDLKKSNIYINNNINLDIPDDIAKSIMVNYWAKALLLWADEVVKLFSPTAFLKWTVVQHLSVWYENWIKDYFEHFCERNPKMKIIDIETKWLKKWESILAHWEYLFDLSDPKQKVPWNFTMIFVKKNGKWMIDLLHSSIKYWKKDLKKLN